MKILFVRGAFLNPFECQNYKKIAQSNDFIAVSSLIPLNDDVPFEVKKKLFSFYDLITIFKQINPLFGRGLNFIANRTLGDAHYLSGIEKYAKDFGPFDLGWGAETYYGYTYQLAKLKQKGVIKKLISTCWEIIPHNNESAPKKRQIKAFNKNNIDLYLCPTNLAKTALIKEGVDKNKIKVIRLGVNERVFYPSSKENDKKTVLFVGRLSKEKGVLDLPDLIYKVTKMDKNIHFNIVGDGPSKRWLIESLCKMNLMSYVSIFTAKYNEMGDVYRNSTVFISLPTETKTITEQYSMAVVEAMACGVSIVSYDVGGPGEILSDKTFIINKANIEEFSIRLVNLCNSRELRRENICMLKKIFDKEYNIAKIQDNISDCLKKMKFS